MKRLTFIAALFFSLSFAGQAQIITPEEGSKHLGKTITVCGKIFGGRFFEKNEKTLLNMGAAYPNSPLTIVIEGADRKKFTGKPEEIYLNKEVCIKGEIRDYKGKPELQVLEVTQIEIKQP